MNILFLTNHLNVGGITRYVLALAAGLKRRGHSVYIASSAGGWLSQFRQEGIHYFPIPIRTKRELSPKIFLSMFKLLSLIKQERMDIVHSNSRTTQVLGSLLMARTGIVHISTYHGFFKKRILRRLFSCLGLKVIAISEAVKDHLINDFKIKEEDIKVIPNGIEVAKYQILNSLSQIQIKKNLGLGDGPVVGIVARLSDVKGHIYLIEAMKTVLGSIANAQLLIVGEGKMKEELQKLIKHLQIEESVFFVPRVSEPQDTLSVMDVFVMPSLKEGLGLALMEAMAMGLAVVGSDVGGIRSLIRNGYNGLLVGPADSQGLSSAILELLRDPKKAKALGEQARIFISHNFSLDKMVQETERLYLECLNAKY